MKYVGNVVVVLKNGYVAQIKVETSDVKNLVLEMIRAKNAYIKWVGAHKVLTHRMIKVDKDVSAKYTTYYIGDGKFSLQGL